MTHKSQALYKATLNYIEDNIFQLNPTSFTTDYERAMRNSLKLIYPEANFGNCWFHFTQSVRRYASKLENFFAMLSKNENLKQAYHMILAVPLLRARDILGVFEMIQLKIQCDEQKDVFDKFLTYFKSQWFKKVSFFIILEYGQSF